MLRRFRPLSINAKVIALIALPSCMVVVFTMGAMAVDEVMVFHRDKQHQLTGVASRVASAAAPHIIAGNRQALEVVVSENVAPREDLVETAVYDERGGLLTRRRNAPGAPAARWADETGGVNRDTPVSTGMVSAYVNMLRSGRLTINEPVLNRGAAIGTVIVTAHTAALNTALRRYVYYTGAALLFLGVALAFVSRWLRRFLDGPIPELIIAIERMVHGEALSVRADSSRSHEIGRLNARLHELLDAIQQRDQINTERIRERDHHINVLTKRLLDADTALDTTRTESAQIKRSAEISKPIKAPSSAEQNPAPALTPAQSIGDGSRNARAVDPDNQFSNPFATDSAQRREIAPAPSRPVEEWTPSSHLAGSRILVVAASPLEGETLSDQLYAGNMLCDIVSDAAMALSALQRAASQGQPYNLTIIDREGLDRDGLALARLIRRNVAFRELPILLMCVSGTEATPSELAAIGITGHISKPFSANQLHETLVSAFEETTLIGTAASAEPSTSGYTVAVSMDSLVGQVLIAVNFHDSYDELLDTVRSFGLSVVTAVTGWEALATLERVQCDLVLMSCTLPELNGIKTTTIIRRRELELQVPISIERPVALRLPIIGLTDRSGDTERRACLAAGMDDYIAIPCERRQIYEALGRWLSKPPEPPITSQAPGSIAHPPMMGSQVPVQLNHAPIIPKSHKEQRPMSNSPPNGLLDQQALDNIRALQRPGSRVFEKVLGIFLKDTPAALAEMESALHARDAKRVAHLAHRLKSGSANLGATALAEILRELETVCREGSLNGAATLVARAKDEYGLVASALHHELQISLADKANA